jgi:hypothetical protein
LRKASLAAVALSAVMVPLPQDGAQASGGGGGGEGLHLVPMDEITVPIIESDRVSGALRFKLVLDGGNDEVAADMTAKLPELRAATVAAGLEFARLNASGLRAVDAEQLDHDLTAALKAAEPGLARVLIVEVEATRA